MNNDFATDNEPVCGLFGLVLVPMTILISMRRNELNGFFLHGDGETLLRRIHSHTNFLQYVPIGLILVALVELNGSSTILIYGLGAALLILRIVHYITLNTNPVAISRAISMLGTTAVFLVASGWLIFVRF